MGEERCCGQPVRPAVDAAGGGGIVVNGEPRRLRGRTSVAELLRTLGVEPGMVVVELNRQILARRELASTRLREGDRVEVVHFVGGG